MMMCGVATAWGSRLQPTVALGTVEAEYMALAAAAQEVIFLRGSDSYSHLWALWRGGLHVCLRTTRDASPWLLMP